MDSSSVQLTVEEMQLVIIAMDALRVWHPATYRRHITTATFMRDKIDKALVKAS